MSDQTESIKKEDIEEESAKQEAAAEAEVAENAGTQDPEEQEPFDDFDVPEEMTERDRQAGMTHSKKRNRRHKKKHRLLRLLIVAAVVAVFVGIANLPYFEIREVPVIGNKVVTDEEILELSGIQTGDSIFALNPFGIKSRIKKNLYISDVKISREFPGTVELIVTEREASAQFVQESKDGKKSYVVTDENGMVMGKSKKRQNVTMIDDVGVSGATEGQQIKVDDTGAYNKSMELIAAAKQGDLYFKRIKMQGSLTEAYIFDELVCKGRYRNIIDSIETGELKSVVYKLYQDDVSKGTINIGDNNYCSFTPEN